MIECKKNGLTVKHPNYGGGNNDDWPFYCAVATKDYLKLVSEEFERSPGGSGGCGDFVGDTQNTETCISKIQKDAAITRLMSYRKGWLRFIL